MSSDELLFGRVAAELGHTIAESAIWFDGRCNWIGALPRNESQEPVAIAALGADLYGGTSGVALFLAQAGTKLDDDCLRTTAVWAISHALDHANRLNPALRDGFYLGPIGVAYAAAHVAGLLDRDEVMTRARELLSEWRGDGRR